MSRFDLIETPIRGVVALVRKPLGDARGAFERLYCAHDLGAVLGERTIVQINRSLTGAAGTVRGLHFQHPPHAETKIVSCLRGAIFDVAVDLRRGSPTFLAWHGRILSADNHESLVVPEGCAHGFQTLEDECEVLYLHTAAHAPEAEGGLDACDPAIAVAWPLPTGVRSQRDLALPPADGFVGLPS